MGNVIDVLTERGFVERATHGKELFEFVDAGSVTCYIGFDPTASSLHVGSLIPIMALAHMQRHGHRPIALVGGGTGLVGDPSGKTEMRKLLTPESVQENANCIKQQLSRFIRFDAGHAIIVNNADWLLKLGYISFLRDVGRHFSVNRMIKAESYKSRLDSEDGLNFIEFNYMVLQAYDFLNLYDGFGCRIQMGGSDQWGNIVAGIELIRRIRHEPAFGITFPLITTSSGSKMGKTAEGAVWLDPEKTSPYEYYQFWINTDDRDVERFMSLFTFLPVEEIRQLRNLTGEDLNAAKAVLAFEATKLAHGREHAVRSYLAATSMFGSRSVLKDFLPGSDIPREDDTADDASVPFSSLPQAMLSEGIPAFKLLQLTGLTKSGGEARRLIDQGGAYMNGSRISSFDYLITDKDARRMEIVLRVGKKRFHKIKLR